MLFQLLRCIKNTLLVLAFGAGNNRICSTTLYIYSERFFFNIKINANYFMSSIFITISFQESYVKIFLKQYQKVIRCIHSYLKIKSNILKLQAAKPKYC